MTNLDIRRGQWQPTPVLLPGKSHGRRSLVGCSRCESDTIKQLLFHFSLSCIGEGNGNPLQYSCLENPRDAGAWWAAINGVVQSQTRLKQFSSSSRQHIQKQRYYFANKVHLVKAMVFPVVMYGCESWTIKKAEHRRIDTFVLWCWGRLMRVPWTARRSNKSILKEISPECTLEGLMLKLNFQYFGHLMGRTDSLEKTLMLGKIEGRRRRGRQRIR